MLKDIKTIFFDYDGTIHNSIKIYAPAFRKAYDYLVQKGVAENRTWTDNEISYWLGFSSKEMWKNFMPDLDNDLMKEASSMIGMEMKNQIDNNNAELYDGALEVLQYLINKGYKLIFISNCGIYYRDMAKDTFILDNYFVEMACSEEYDYIPKYEILRRIKGKYPENMVIIGDRFQDIEAGKKNNISTIGCSYGYNKPDELKEADIIIHNIIELKKYL